MKRSTEILLFLFSDFLTINLAWTLYYYIRVESGLILLAHQPSFWDPMMIVCLYWISVFLFMGMYQHWNVRSRYDEFISVLKAVTFGSLLLFFAIFLDDFVKDAKVVSRYLILIYWGFLLFFVSSGRILIRHTQINLMKKGIGLRNTIVIGNEDKTNELKQTIEEFPQHGYRYIGKVGINFDQEMAEEIGKIEDLSSIIQYKNVKEVLVGLTSEQKPLLEKIIFYCSNQNVDIKIMPDMYDAISGLVKTNQLYGIPLVSIFPEIITYPEKVLKRAFDILSSFFMLIITSPIIFITFIAIKIESKGPAIYIQERVGRNGNLFNIYKFRSMYIDAEIDGPKWAGKEDPRVTKVGRFLRRTRIDEIPQFYNVIKSDMSIVGPRPERPYFVSILQKEIPYYNRRLKVKPGITGWAQIKHDYDESINDVKEKLQYDFYYIENMSLSLDFKIIINTVFVVLSMKGR